MKQLAFLITLSVMTGSLEAAPPDAATLSKLLDSMSEAELAALLKRVKDQSTGKVEAPQVPAPGRPTPGGLPEGTPVVPPPGKVKGGMLSGLLSPTASKASSLFSAPTPVPEPAPDLLSALAPPPVPAPVSAVPSRKLDTRTRLRVKVAAHETAASILQALGAAGKTPKVRAAVNSLTLQAYSRSGDFSHLKMKAVPLSRGEAKLLAAKVTSKVQEVMPGDASFQLSHKARKVFEARILAATPANTDGELAKVKAATAARLNPTPPPPVPLTPEEIAAIDAIMFRRVIAERKINNHSSQVLKKWAEEESRRRRRTVLARGRGRAVLRTGR